LTKFLFSLLDGSLDFGIFIIFIIFQANVLMVYWSCLLCIERSVCSSNLWVKHENLLWLRISLVIEVCLNISGGSLVSSNFLWFSLSIERSMSSSNLWVKNENLLWLRISLVIKVLSNISGGSLVSSNFLSDWFFLEKSSGDWSWWVKLRWVSWADVTGGLVWLTGGWLSVVVWDGIWLFVSAWGTGWAIEWTVGS
jgi:hypothetical protein